MVNKTIKYDELLQKMKQAEKVTDKIIVFALAALAIGILLIFILNDSGGSFIVKMIVPIFIILMGAISMFFKKIIGNRNYIKLEEYKNEINEYCIASFGFNYVYTKKHIITTGINGSKFRAIPLSEMASAHNFAALGLKPGELHNLLLGFYKKDEQGNINNELEKKVLVQPTYKSFNHRKYGAIEYLELDDNFDEKNSEILFKFKNSKGEETELTVYVLNEKIDEFLKNDEIKGIIMDKYFDYSEKYLLKSKKIFVESKIDDILNWFEGSEKDVEDNPLYTKNKTKDEFKNALMNSDNYYISIIHLDKDYNISNALFKMDLGDIYYFTVDYDTETEKIYYDVIS